MTNKFANKVIRELMVDTRKYRYVYEHGKIYRIPLEWLSTTMTLDRDNWTLIRDCN